MNKKDNKKIKPNNKQLIMTEEEQIAIDMEIDEQGDIEDGKQPDLPLSDFLHLSNWGDMENEHVYKYTKEHGWGLRDIVVLDPAFIGISDRARVEKNKSKKDESIRSISAHATRLDAEGVVLRHRVFNRETKAFEYTGKSENLYTEINVQGNRGVILLDFVETTKTRLDEDYSDENHDINNIYLGIERAKKLVNDLTAAIAAAELKKDTQPVTLVMEEDLEDYE
jgi:hypothetical protein